MYKDASDDACGAQLSHKHDGQNLLVALLSHTFIDIQQKRSTTEQEASGIYYAVTKWNYYLQGFDIIDHNDYKPVQKFLNGKNTKNNKVNRWVSGTCYLQHHIWVDIRCNKAGDCLSWLVDVKDTPASPTALIHMLVTSTPDGHATHICSKTCNTADNIIHTDPTTISTYKR